MNERVACRIHRVHRVDTGVFWGLAALVVLAPLPLGSNRPWAWFALATGVGALLTLWFAGMTLAGRPQPVAAHRLRVPLLLFVGVCLWVVIQWAPWTPTAWHHPLWEDAGRVLGRELAGRISVNPDATLSALTRLLCYGGVFWLSLQLGRRFERARLGMHLMVYAGAAYALYGLVVQFSGSEKILWMDKWAYRGVVTSTFVNRNSYATYAGLTLVCAFALYLNQLGRVLRTNAPGRVKLRLGLDRLLGPAAPLFVAMLLLGTALLLTESRAGASSTLLGLVVLLGTALFGRTIPIRQAGVLSLVLLLAGVGVFSISGEKLAERLAGTETRELTRRGRGAAYAIVVRAIGDAPLRGTGYGTFRDVFPLYRDESIEGPLIWDKAHNTYLENALELGIPATAALCGAVLGCARCCWLGIRRRRRNRLYPGVGVATTALVAAHATVDFSLQIPAVAVTYGFILGIACAQSFPSESGRDSRP